MSTNSSIRAARKLAARPSSWEVDDFDDTDDLTDESALDFAEIERLHTPQVLIEAFEDLVGRDEQQMIDAESSDFDPSELSAEKLFVVTLYGSVIGREMARNELAERIRASMAESVAELARDKLNDQERERDRMRDEWMGEQMERRA